jgi:hypothetical protein
VEQKRVQEKAKVEEKERKDWFEKHLKSGLEKELDGLEQYQNEEMEVTEKNLKSNIDKEKEKLEKDLKDLEDSTASKLEANKIKHALEYANERYKLHLAENDAEFERDNNGVYANYEQQKKMSVMDVARLDALLKETEGEEEKKKVEHDLQRAKKDIEGVTELYEEDKKKALQSKEEFAAELRFLKYAKLSDTELLKAYHFGEVDDEEESEEFVKKPSQEQHSVHKDLPKISLDELAGSESEGEANTEEESEQKGED